MRALSTIRKAFSRWNDHEGQRLGAALAFYALLSAAPLVVFAVFLTSTILGPTTAQRIVTYAEQTLGPSTGAVVRNVLTHALHPHHSDLAAALALGALLFGASGAFLELRDDLNKMWDARTPSRGIFGMIFQRIFSFLLVLAAGILLLASMLATTALSVVSKFFHDFAPLPPMALEAANLVLSLVLLSLVFLLVFRFVPDRRLPWRALLPGALLTAILLSLGKALLGVYMTKIGVGSAYGAAGSVIALAFFIYYAAQIFLFGAEFTYLWALRKLQGAEALAHS